MFLLFVGVLGGVTLLEAGCGSEPVPVATSTGAVTASSAVTSQTSAASAVSTPPIASVTRPPSSTSAAVASADGDDFSVAAADARGAGVGFRIKSVKGSGLSRIEGDWLLGFSGPPGGPLGLLIEAYVERPTLKVAFEKREQRRPVDARPEEQIEIAGEKRRAQSFRVGSSLATTCTCVVDLPAGPGAKSGLLLSFDTGCREKGPVEGCAQLADHPTLKPLLRSLELLR